LPVSQAEAPDRLGREILNGPIGIDNMNAIQSPDSTAATGGSTADGDLGDMLNELRILLPSAQLLTAFLITLPFNSGFAEVIQSEKWVFIATFLCSMISLVMFSAPAVQHRLLRPLYDRQRFKQFASHELLVGSIALAFALILATELVLAEVFGHLLGIALAGSVGGLIGLLWWALPRFLRGKRLF
jgi:ABC-type multidrug transport system permease subunit